MTGEWRLLVLDRDPADPKWILAIVASPADVQPAALDAAGRYQGDEAAGWVEGRTGEPVSLTALHDALAWRVEREP